MKTPDHAGFYWGYIHKNWYVFKVTGEPPFMDYNSLYPSKTTFTLAELNETVKWGLEIKPPNFIEPPEHGFVGYVAGTVCYQNRTPPPKEQEK